MKQVISLVLFGLFCGSAVLTDASDQNKPDGASQSGRIVNGKAVSIVKYNMICAKYGNGVDTCKGDSGGALVCGGGLAGVVSFTNLECTSAWPAGFSKISAPSIRRFISTEAGI
uniref:Peptidase S1 domain-containing protein n=1 Tax=Anopheles coluzzii TaxID=1518534 RepID=A0A8W7PTX6_ANOCL